MQVSITGRHVELTEPLKAYVNDKLQHLKHSFDHVVDVHVVLSVEKIRQRCEVNMQANGISIHASHETDDMYASIDGVMDKLNRQLKRYRAKLRKHLSQHRQRKGRDIKVAHRVIGFDESHEELPETQAPKVLNHKSIQAQTMSVDEAVMQMELAENKNVLIFTNADTDTLNALYRRSDGSFNWIEPEH
jgi:putative sigma-54 modulation protein